jgi:hypothetical protein
MWDQHFITAGYQNAPPPPSKMKPGCCAYVPLEHHVAVHFEFTEIWIIILVFRLAEANCFSLIASWHLIVILKKKLDWIIPHSHFFFCAKFCTKYEIKMFI